MQNYEYRSLYVYFSYILWMKLHPYFILVISFSFEVLLSSSFWRTVSSSNSAEKRY